MEIDQTQLLKTATSFLKKNKISYMITGAWSVIYYGRPRASHDIDFVVELRKEDAKRILEALQSLPREFSYQSHAIKDAIERSGIFQILYLPTYLKLDFWLLTDNPFDQERFARREKVRLLDQEMTIATAEDTILQKLRWYKEVKIEKHIIDAVFVYQIQRKHLDKKYLRKWARFLKITQFLNRLSKIDLEKYL